MQMENKLYLFLTYHNGHHYEINQNNMVAKRDIIQMIFCKSI